MKLQAKLRMITQRSWSKASKEAINELSGDLRYKLSVKLTKLPAKLKKVFERS